MPHDYTFARVGAVLEMNVRDYFSQGRRGWMRLHEKRGKLYEAPCHHKLESYMDEYLAAAGYANDVDGPLWRATGRKTGIPQRLTQRDAYLVIERRAKQAGVKTKIGNRSLRATGLTDYLRSGRALGKAQEMANHSSPRTTKLYGGATRSWRWTIRKGGDLISDCDGCIDHQMSASKPAPEDIKEVYARFGLAYYHGEVLHRGLCNFYCLSQLPPVGPVTRPRVEEHLRTAIGSTLGKLLQRLDALLPPMLLRRLKFALERRNFIAHHFWYERIHLMTTLEGIEAIVAELSEDTDLFCELDREIDKLTEPLYSRVGMTPELFTMALNETLSGKACAPLCEQREPKKEETIVEVFNVPRASGNAVLTFQTEDALLWQLCDSGLGWSPYEEVDPSWSKAKKFIGLLPAKINPRPKIVAPWTFEIPFGAKATLSVAPGKASGQILYRLIRKP